MLSAWYFCCCIGISDEKTNVFLSILDTLQDQDDVVDDELIFLAYTQLRRTEIWMQIYAVPYVLHSLHQDRLSKGSGIMAEQYLNDLLELLPSATIRGQFEELKKAILLGTDTNSILQTLKKCAKTIEHTPYRMQTEKPYLDLETFLPETMLLAILSDQILHNSSFAAILSADLRKSIEISPLESLVEKALEHQFGRQAFLFAARLAPLVLEKYDRNSIASKIWFTQSRAAELEPDLIQATANVLYFDRKYKNYDEEYDPQQIVLEMVYETISFSQWRWLQSRRRGSRDEGAILERLGLGGSSQVHVLSRILWQVTLWETAAHIDAKTTAEKLKYHWSAPRNLPSQLEPIAISASFSYKDEGRAWINDLSTLYPLHTDKTLEITFRRDMGPGARPPFIHKWRASHNLTSWLFLSPWLQLNTDSINYNPQKQRGTKRPPRYPKATNSFALLRLLASARVAITLMCNLPPEDDTRSTYAALIAHAYDVLNSSYRDKLMSKRTARREETNQAEEGTQPEEGNFGLSKQMTGLARFCKEQLRWVGQAKQEHVTPETFLNLLRKKEDYHYLDKEFLEFVLPEVLVLWIEDAYTDTTDLKGAGRWLQHINEVYDYHRPDPRHDYRSQYRAAAIVRFLVGSHDIKVSDWRLDRRKSWKYIGHRQLLLSPDLQALEWEPDGWRDPDWESPGSKRDLKQVQLARAIQRLAAFTYDELKNRQQVPGTWFNNWFDEWRSCMHGLDKISLDRFARLSLLELIDKPALADSSEGQELIAYTLLEYGTPYDHQKLIQRIYWQNDQDQEILPLAPANTTRQRLRKIVLKAMYQSIEQAGATNQESQQNARVPYTVRSEQQKHLFFQQTLLRIAYIARIYPEDSTASFLRDALVDAHKQAMERRCNQPVKVLQAEVELQSKGKRILLPQRADIHDTMLRGAVYDPNLLKLSLYYENSYENAPLNLFEASKEEINRFRNEHKSQPECSRPVKLVGVVVDENARPNGMIEYVINFGLDRYVTALTDSESPLPSPSFGTCVGVSVFWDGRYRRWHTQRDLKPLRRSLLAGDIDKTGIREYWPELNRTGKRKLSLRNPGNPYFNSEPESSIRHLWDADTSRNFLNFRQPADREVYVERQSDGTIVPIERSLLQLLLDGHSFADGKVFILTLIEASTDSVTGEASWLFSTQPGVNYRLYRNAFQVNAADELKQKTLDRVVSDDIAGLLLAVTPDIDPGMGTLCLKLFRPHVDGAVDTDLQQFYPQFTWPIDWRNCKWRKLFDDTERFVAEREADTKDWFVKLEGDDRLPVYPDKIRVEWERRYPSYNAKKADLDSPQWNKEQWFNQSRPVYIVASCEGMYRIKPAGKDRPDSQDWQEFLNRWLNLDRGNRLALEAIKSTLATRSDGTILCLTNEGVMVRVDADSLTMKPLEARERPSLDALREAEVSALSDWRRAYTVPQIEDISEIPSETYMGDTCLGILIGVPARSDQSDICTILWKTQDETKRESESITISNFSQLSKEGVGLGSKIVGKRMNESWYLWIETRIIWAKALWMVQEWDALARDEDAVYTYLGSLYYNEQTRPVAETRPGELVLLPHPPANAQHLAQLCDDGSGSLIISKPGIRLETNLQNKTKPGAYYNEGFFHVMLAQGEKILTGWSRDQAQNLSPLFAGVSMKGIPRLGGLLLLQREFKLRFTTADIPIQKKEQSTKEKLLQKLNEYFAENRPALEGEMQSNRLIKLQNMQVPQDLPPYEKWSDVVPLRDEQSPFVADAKYQPRAYIRLMKEANGRIVASVLDVEAYTLEEYRVYLSANFDVSVPLENYNLLYYVGPEEAHPVTKEPYKGGLQYRFEWGRGRTLLVPERQLLFNGEPFINSSLLLCHGDSIGTIQFRNSDPPLLSIYGYSLQFSPARTLFAQRKDFNIVHVLHLVIENEHVRIESIEGFNERSDTDTTQQFRLRGPQAMQLTSESEQRLLLRERENLIKGERVKINILGKLNEESFKDTLGRELHFEQVRFSLTTTEDGPGLKGDELVFVEAGHIFERPNDMALQIKAYSGLKSSDVGNDMDNLQVLRRNFSVRENLLNRLYEANKKDYLEGFVLLLRLRALVDGKVQASMVDGIPPRKTAALTFSDRNTNLLVTWVKSLQKKDREYIRVELKPGTFVDIPQLQLVEYPDDIVEGAIVSLKSINVMVAGAGNEEQQRFIMTRASFGDEHYIPESTRFAVTLPTNDLLSEQIWQKNNVHNYRFWQDRRSFTIGGLPNIVASPGTYNQRDQRWSSPRAEDFKRLMETEHPKIVRLGKDGVFNRIAPAAQDVSVGKLESVADGLGVMYAPLRGDNGGQPLTWRYLSFGDEAVIDIMERIDRESWRYHDATTGHWMGETLVRTKLYERLHNAWEGPLFFELVGQYKRLRYNNYNKESFLKYGFPVDELIRSLKKAAPGSRTYPVAGISNDDSIWLEMSPGRLIELPIQLVVWQLKGHEVPLANLNWQSFAPGDKVDLSLAPGDLLAIDRIILQNWIPGPRASFGEKRCILPVLNYDPEMGAVKLGAGEFMLTLPAESFNPAWRTVVLYPNNNLHPLTKDFEMEPGDVVLLGLGDQEVPIVQGISWQLTASQNLEAPASWERDQLGLVVQNIRSARRLNEIISAAGGALPVTVDKVIRKQVYFSTPYLQRAAYIPVGKIVMAHLLGSLYNGREALLRVGGGLLTMPMNKIIFGLPEAYSRAALEKLKQAGIPIWLRHTEQGTIEAGLEEERIEEILVDAIDVITAPDERDYGIVCQSINTTRLYWLPARQVAWAQLSADTIRHIFINRENRRSFKVYIRNDYRSKSYASVIDVQDVRKELDNLEIGKELHVRILAEGDMRDGSRSYLAEHFGTGTVLVCESYNNENLELESEIPVEVVRVVSDAPPSVVVAPLGTRRFFLDLPTWVWQKSTTDTEQEPDYEHWLSAPLEESEALANSGDIRQKSKKELDKLLYTAFVYKDTPFASLQLQGEVAPQWFKRNIHEHEMSVGLAAMTIVLLDEIGNTPPQKFAATFIQPDEIKYFTHYWRLSAVRLAYNLGRRALRSLHIETLISEWLCHPVNSINTDNMWKRLQLLKDVLRPSLQGEQITSIRKFCQAVQLRIPSLDLLSIAESLAAATGQTVDFARLKEKSEYGKALIEIYQTLPQPDKVDLYLHESHLRRLEHMVKQIRIHKVDITLLDPLPEVEPQ